MALVLSQEQVQSLVDAVMVLVVINVDTQTPLGMMRRQVTCDVCHGRGKKSKIHVQPVTEQGMKNKRIAYVSLLV